MDNNKYMDVPIKCAGSLIIILYNWSALCGVILGYIFNSVIQLVFAFDSWNQTATVFQFWASEGKKVKQTKVFHPGGRCSRPRPNQEATPACFNLRNVCKLTCWGAEIQPDGEH